ncbi:hypothetical protein H5410_056267 [Solanum commersonii]|uniref:Uncharacterized protein n=1 Tax=Solanum commersonii TaxID=4109 RepID=A0A9J5WL81_SOLCO|nr:hypothetical protein H5410_056267 [Solanum commersonii]
MINFSLFLQAITPSLPLSKGLIFGEVLANEFHISLLLYAMALCALKICFRNSSFESRVYRKSSLNPHKDRDKVSGIIPMDIGWSFQWMQGVRKKISHILTKEETQLENALSYLSLFRRIHNKNGMKFRTPSFPSSSRQWREVEGIEMSREMVTARLGLIHLI